jgi:hypothetical protein
LRLFQLTLHLSKFLLAVDARVDDDPKFLLICFFDFVDVFPRSILDVFPLVFVFLNHVSQLFLQVAELLFFGLLFVLVFKFEFVAGLVLVCAKFGNAIFALF